MTYIVRQKGSRRFGLPVEFPLMDGQGVFVIKDRRQITNRRKVKDYLDELEVMISEIADN